MTDEVELEVYRALRDAQNRYAYFLLAAAGGAIALAVNQTKDASLHWSQTPLAIAALMWGLSFFCGCRHLAYVSSTLYTNSELLRVQNGTHPVIRSAEAVALARTKFAKVAEENADRGNRYGHWQFRFLVIGAVVYVAWHVLEMYLRGLTTA